MAGLGYMNPHRLCYGFMLSFPVVQIVAICTLMGMLMSKEAKRMVWSREIVVLVIFIIWMGITTTQALYVDLAVEQYKKVIKIQILTLMTLLMLNGRNNIHLFVWVVVLSARFLWHQRRPFHDRRTAEPTGCKARLEPSLEVTTNWHWHW